MLIFEFSMIGTKLWHGAQRPHVEPVIKQESIFNAPTVHALGFGLSANGRLDVSPLQITLHDRYPVFISDYRRKGRAGLLAPGTVYVWRESQPWLAALIIRQTPQGAARLRYVEAALLWLYHNWEREGIESLAIARFATADEWDAARDLLISMGRMLPGQLVIYEESKD